MSKHLSPTRVSSRPTPDESAKEIGVANSGNTSTQPPRDEDNCAPERDDEHDTAIRNEETAAPRDGDTENDGQATPLLDVTPTLENNEIPRDDAVAAPSRGNNNRHVDGRHIHIPLPETIPILEDTDEDDWMLYSIARMTYSNGGGIVFRAMPTFAI